jgi:hypothetical protein
MRTTAPRSSRSRRRWALLACGMAIALTALPAAADQSEELARLREDAAQLRQAQERLEARIQALENQNRNAPGGKDGMQDPSSTSISSLVSLKKNWSQVQRGMRQDGVEALLGKPETLLRIDGTPVWYYAYPGIGRGSVFFNGDGTVSSAQSPTFGW